MIAACVPYSISIRKSYHFFVCLLYEIVHWCFNLLTEAIRRKINVYIEKYVNWNENMRWWCRKTIIVYPISNLPCYIFIFTSIEWIHLHNILLYLQNASVGLSCNTEMNKTDQSWIMWTWSITIYFIFFMDNWFPSWMFSSFVCRLTEQK